MEGGRRGGERHPRLVINGKTRHMCCNAEKMGRKPGGSIPSRPAEKLLLLAGWENGRGEKRGKCSHTGEAVRISISLNVR